MRNPDAIRFASRLLCFLPLMGGLATMEWIGGASPVRQFATRKVDAAAAALLAGNTIWSEIEMVDLKSVWIERMHTPVDLVVLGSSRAAQVSQSWFPGRKVLNAAVLGSDFLDSVALFEDCLDSGKSPKTVVLELSPVLAFDDRASVSPALEGPFRRALLRYGIFRPKSLPGMFTLEAFRWDVHLSMSRPVWRASQHMEQRGFRIHPDGAVDWRTSETRDTAEEVERKVAQLVHHQEPRYQRWRTTSTPAWIDRRLLRSFVDDLQARGIRLVILLVPVQPLAFDYYHRQGGYDDTWIRNEMSRRGVEVVGSYAPSVSHVTKDDFCDDVHMRAGSLHRLLKESGLAE